MHAEAWLTPRGRRVGAATVLALLALGCASNPAPAGTLKTAEEMGQATRGGYILIHTATGSVEGELIAVGPSAVFVYPKGSPDGPLAEVPIPTITTARLAAYATSPGLVIGLGLLGTVSTLSHGAVLVVSAPVWLLSTFVLGYIESGGGLMDYPDHPITDLAPFARFPQGLPEKLGGEVRAPSSAPARIAPAGRFGVAAFRFSSNGFMVEFDPDNASLRVVPDPSRDGRVYALSTDDATLLRDRVAAANLQALRPSSRDQRSGEALYFFGLRGAITYSAVVWAEDALADPKVAELVALLRSLVQTYGNLRLP